MEQNVVSSHKLSLQGMGGERKFIFLADTLTTDEAGTIRAAGGSEEAMQSTGVDWGE